MAAAVDSCIEGARDHRTEVATAIKAIAAIADTIRRIVNPLCCHAKIGLRGSRKVQGILKNHYTLAVGSANAVAADCCMKLSRMAAVPTAITRALKQAKAKARIFFVLIL